VNASKAPVERSRTSHFMIQGARRSIVEAQKKNTRYWAT
jgi:hypothetical protein